MKTLPATHMKSSASLADTLKRYPLAAFFTLAYLGSWIVWSPMVLAGNNLLLPSSAVPPGLRFLLTVLAPFAGPQGRRHRNVGQNLTWTADPAKEDRNWRASIEAAPRTV